MDEFALIGRYFQPLGKRRADIECGIGDDCAVLEPGAGRLAVTVDTLVEGVHFRVGIRAAALGYRAAAVSLSDLAAMAAQPRYATLALTLPRVDEDWLADFADGLGEALDAAGCALVGGDTTRGPLTVTLQLIGTLDGPAPVRAGAQPGDVVLVSGTLGDAHAALSLPDDAEGDDDRYLRQRFERPTPRIALARDLRGLVQASIDVSDGLLADLGHVARASGVAIAVEAEALPLSPALLRRCGRERALAAAVSGGDDYELVLVVAADRVAEVLARARVLGERLSVIGEVRSGSGVALYDADGRAVTPARGGYDHFA